MCKIALLAPVTGEFSPQRPVTRGFDVFFDLRLNKRSSNWDAIDLRRHRAHCDVTVPDKRDIVEQGVSPWWSIVATVLFPYIPWI